MQHDTAKLLTDMRNAGARIQRYAAGRTYVDYLSDDYFRSAVERQFEIVGEAMTRLVKSDPSTAASITDYRKIAGIRNAIIHGYDSIDDTITWSVIENKLPVLMRELDALLAQ